MRKFIPAGYRILVKTKKTVTESGIILTTTEEEASTECHVIAVGKQSYYDVGDAEPWCKVGDLVVISKYSGTIINMGDKDNIYRAINDKDIIGHFEGEGLNG